MTVLFVAPTTTASDPASTACTTVGAEIVGINATSPLSIACIAVVLDATYSRSARIPCFSSSPRSCAIHSGHTDPLTAVYTIRACVSGAGAAAPPPPLALVAAGAAPAPSLGVAARGAEDAP